MESLLRPATSSVPDLHDRIPVADAGHPLCLHSPLLSGQRRHIINSLCALTSFDHLRNRFSRSIFRVPVGRSRYSMFQAMFSVN